MEPNQTLSALINLHRNFQKIDYLQNPPEKKARKGKQRVIQNTNEERAQQLEAQTQQTLQQLKNEYPNYADLLNGLFEQWQNGDVVENDFDRLSNDLNSQLGYVNDDWFDINTYARILPWARLMYAAEQNGLAEEHAYKLAVMFNSEAKAFEYLRTFMNKNKDNNQPMHDACLFVLPQESFDIKTWRQLAGKLKTEKNFWQILPNAWHVEEKIRNSSVSREQSNNKTFWDVVDNPEAIQSAISDKTKKQLKEQTDLTNQLKNTRLIINNLRGQYNKLASHADRATPEDEKNKNRLLQNLFNAQYALTKLGPKFDSQLTLEDLRAFEAVWKAQQSESYNYFLRHNLTPKDYERFVHLTRKDDDTQIPDIKLDGRSVGEGYSDYYMMKIPVQDEAFAAKAACLGKLTNCCQSISKEAGEPCATHGLTSPYGGFYILCKGNVNNPKVDDPVIAQSWTWRSQNGAIVFDSIESGVNHYKADSDMVVNFYRTLSKQMVDGNHTHKVVCGQTHGFDSDYFVSILDSSAKENFIDYQSYNDSLHQKVINEPASPYYWYSLDDSSKQLTEDLLQQKMASARQLAYSSWVNSSIKCALSGQSSELLECIRTVAKNNSRQDEVSQLITDINYNLIKTAIDNQDSRAIKLLNPKVVDFNVKNSDNESLMSITLQKAQDAKSKTDYNNFLQVACSLVTKDAKVGPNDLFKIVNMKAKYLTTVRRNEFSPFEPLPPIDILIETLQDRSDSGLTGDHHQFADAVRKASKNDLDNLVSYANPELLDHYMGDSEKFSEIIKQNDQWDLSSLLDKLMPQKQSTETEFHENLDLSVILKRLRDTPKIYNGLIDVLSKNQNILEGVKHHAKRGETGVLYNLCKDELPEPGREQLEQIASFATSIENKYESHFNIPSMVPKKRRRVIESVKQELDHTLFRCLKELKEVENQNDKMKVVEDNINNFKMHVSELSGETKKGHKTTGYFSFLGSVQPTGSRLARLLDKLVDTIDTELKKQPESKRGHKPD